VAIHYQDIEHSDLSRRVEAVLGEEDQRGDIMTIPGISQLKGLITPTITKVRAQDTRQDSPT
jgi:hypothetical protein